MSLIEQSTLAYLRLEKKLTSGVKKLIPHGEAIEEKVCKIFPRYKERVTSHSDFYTRFLEYVENRETKGEDVASQQTRLQILNILRSVGQEAKGIGEMFQLATKVELDNEGHLRYSNPVYNKGQDIKAWWDEHILHDAHDRRERIRFQRERDQLIEYLFPTLSEPLFDAKEVETQVMTSHLLSQGFIARTVPLTKGIRDVCPELPPYQENQEETIDLLIGPNIGTVSPKSIVHNNGETSILWINRLAYIPSTGSWMILQDGRFSRYSDSDLDVFLSLGKEKRSGLGLLNREAQLMNTLAILDTPFAYQHATVVFDHLAKLTKKPFGSKSIQGAEKSMTADLSRSVDYLLEIFQFEYKRCTEHPEFITGLRDRIQKFAGEKHVLHHLATDENLNLEACLSLYMKVFSEVKGATNPRSQRQLFDAGTLAFYPKFSIRVNLSMLDCGAGTIIGAAGKITSLGELRSTLGLGKFQMLANIEGRSIRDREEFEHIARSFGKDPGRFTTWGVCKNEHCASHGQHNYLGECGWCLSCEIKDDLGIHGDISKFLTDHPGILSHAPDENADALSPRKTVGLGFFVSSLAHGGVKNILETIAEYPEYFSI